VPKNKQKTIPISKPIIEVTLPPDICLNLHWLAEVKPGKELAVHKSQIVLATIKFETKKIQN
jgi:hypothetical protein